MILTPLKPRENLYNLLDQVIESGEPLEIKRKGKTLKIILEEKRPKLSNIVGKKITCASDEALITPEWEKK